jgi:hypothetical protein
MATRNTLFALGLCACAIPASAQILPQFHGTWVGSCDYTQVDGTNEVVSLTITIAPLSATEVSWGLNYQGGSIGTLVKNYVLRAVDVAANHYVLDEQNGILIDEYLFGDRLVSSFDVGNDTRLAASTTVDGNTMHFENVAYGGRQVNRTRGGGVAVLSYGAQSIESCDLLRQ